MPHPLPLAHRVVLVTGASRGLGHALTHRLAAAGARVAAGARDAEGLSSLRGALGEAVFVHPVDVRDADAVRDFVARAEDALGPLDAAVNNAGVGQYKPFHEHAIADCDVMVDVNLKGVLHVCHAVLPGMRGRRSGHIVNIASDLARRPLANMAVYAATKHAVAGFSHSLLREVKGDGVKVTLVNPGIIDTFFGGSEPGRDEAWALRPEVVADAIVHLLAQPPHVVIDELAIHPLGQDF